MPEIKKIGIFLSVAPYSGGMFQYCQSILNAAASLPSDSYSVVICYTDKNWEPFLKESSIPARYISFNRYEQALGKLWTLAGLPVRLMRRFSRMCSSVVQTMLKEKCDLWFFPAQDPWAYQFPLPALGTVHDLMHRYEGHFPEVSAKGRYRYREAHFKNLCAWCRGVLVDSETGKRQVIESYGLSNDRASVLPYIPAPHIYDAPCPVDFDENFTLPPRFFLYPAQFWPHKNHLRLVEAIARLKPDIPDISLVLVGAFNHAYPEIRQRIQELGLDKNVLFVGIVSDEHLPEFYRRARALIMPTFFGPTNIPPLEAFALGCPVAVSDIYGMPEQTGSAALRFDPLSVEGISECMRSLWQDDELCKRLIQEGRLKSSQWNQDSFNASFAGIIKRYLQKP